MQSVTRPVFRHGPAPKVPDASHMTSSTFAEASTLIQNDQSSDFEPEEQVAPRLNQARLNELVRNLRLSKDDAELLASRLQEERLLGSATRVSLSKS